MTKNNLFIIFFIGLFLFAIMAFKPQSSIAQNNDNEQWHKLNPEVSINLNSIKQGEENSKSAWFKLLPTNEKIYTTDGMEASRKEMQIEAWCDVNALLIKHVKYYDKKGNLLQDSPNTHGVGCEYEGLVNGKIYYKALCK